MTTTIRAPRRDAVHNRESLIAAARSVLNDDPEASLDAIARAAGLSRRAFYGHFATREALIAEVVDAGAERVAEAVAAVRDPDPVVELALLGRVVWDQIESVRVTTRLAVRGPLHQRLVEPLGPLHDRIVVAVTTAAAAGSARRDLDAETVARLIEGAAFTVLDESVRRPLGRQEGRRLVMLAGLAALGLGWREAQQVLQTHAAVLEADDATATAGEPR